MPLSTKASNFSLSHAIVVRIRNVRPPGWADCDTINAKKKKTVIINSFNECDRMLSVISIGTWDHN